MLIPLLALALLIPCNDAVADIYRYLNDEGVECFTDSPTSGKAVKIMKETSVRRTRTSRKMQPARPLSEEAATAVKPSASYDAPIIRGGYDPILPVSGRISSTMGFRHDPIDGVIRDHKGVDIATPEGTPVRPVLPGIVIFSGYRSGYGNTVVVRHEDGMITLYAHNSVNLKTVGEPVDRGSTIAFSGSTGRSTGPHLHFEAWKDGVNLTAMLIPGAAATYAASRDGDGIRRSIQADGTLVFSNLP